MDIKCIREKKIEVFEMMFCGKWGNETVGNPLIGECGCKFTVIKNNVKKYAETVWTYERNRR